MVEQSNFDDYNPTRFSEMPKVEVHIVKSLEAPTGIGEPAVPPLAPAIGNAIAAATGKRLYSLPFDAALLGLTTAQPGAGAACRGLAWRGRLVVEGHLGDAALGQRAAGRRVRHLEGCRSRRGA